jgi:hypothetical protein
MLSEHTGTQDPAQPARRRDLARSHAGTPAFEQSRRERKRAEMLFE